MNNGRRLRLGVSIEAAHPRSERFTVLLGLATRWQQLAIGPRCDLGRVYLRGGIVLNLPWSIQMRTYDPEDVEYLQRTARSLGADAQGWLRRDGEENWGDKLGLQWLHFDDIIGFELKQQLISIT